MPAWTKILRRLARYALIVGGIFVAIFILGIFFLRISYPPAKWQQLVRTELEKRLESKVSFNDIDYSFTGGIYVRDLLLHDLPPGDQGESVMFSAESILVRPQLLPLLRKEIHISSIAITQSSLILKKNKTGSNWQRLPFLRQKSSQEQQPQKSQGGWRFSIISLPALSIEELKISDYSGNPILIRSAYLSGNNSRIIFSVNSENSEGTSGVNANLAFQESYQLNSLKTLPENIRAGKIAIDGAIEFRNFSSPLLPAGLAYIDGKIPISNKGEMIFLEPRHITIKHRKVPTTVIFGGNVSLAGTVLTGSNSSLQIGKNILLKQMSFRHDGNLRSLDGEIEADLAALASLARKSGLTGKVEGKVTLRDGQLNSDLRFQTVAITSGNLKLVENASFAVKISGERFELPETQAMILGQMLRLSAAGSRVGKQWHLKYDVRGDSLALPEILQRLRPVSEPGSSSQEGNSTTSESDPAELPQIFVQGKMHFSKVRYETIEFQNLHADTDLQPDLLRLRNLQAGFSGGQFSGNYQFALRQANHEFSFNFSGLKPNQFFESADIKARWFASLSGSLSGTMAGRTSAEFRQSLKARLRIESGAGRLVNSSMQRGFITGMLGPLEDRLSAIEYRRAALEIAAADDRLYVRQATFDSEDLTLKLMGAAEWNWQADLVADLRFKDSFIRDVANPLQLGIDDVRRGDWYVLPFSCQGKLTDTRCWQKEW